ncbi:MAG: VCBS repeat-containing protein, partial [Bacteroidota bacterium]|nr:VCBS repeat-containing protein [Bacteroidota bacterium]
MAGRWLFFVFIVAFFAKCSCGDSHLFRLVPPSESGIDFNNALPETDSLNILTVDYLYHGAGVAIGDFNNDSLSDIFFTGNIVSNKLYLNRGDLRFEDVTATTGLSATTRWKSGVALADVNNDGWLDIYVCATVLKDSSQRANMLFIHKGLDPNGVPVFEDQASSYGLDDKGYSQNAAFLDYDQDGDLDLYLLQNLESDKIPSVYRPRILDGSALNNDRLFRNNGNGTFTDVTRQAGILVEGYGLGIAIADINNDGWPDIYIGNDYISNDILYINNRNGTFTNEIRDRIKHQSLSTMGIDVADINNDCAPDIVTLDMLPENNLRRKTISGAGATYYNYINNREYDYEFQYMRNMLHLNTGNGKFSEIGQLAGIHQTEWSWSSLLADVDNDGYRDLLVTNGFPKDITDRDYVMFKREVGAFHHVRSLLDSIPVLKIRNYAFRNNGDLSFTDVSAKWGFDTPSFSNGASFADLDNDGDLDYVVNNINDPAFVYENTLNRSKDNEGAHYLRIRLDHGSKPSGAELGAKVELRYGEGERQYHDHSVYRGYLSTVENIVHFGLGSHAVIDTIRVTWPDGKGNVLYHVPANQVLTISYDNADIVNRPTPSPVRRIREVAATRGIHYKHREWDKVDFYRQRTLPHKFSQAGPGISVGDVNGDGREDFIVGGSADFDAFIFTQNTDGSFSEKPLTKTTDKKSEDEGMLLFDADADGDLDLYCVSGSYEGEAGHAHYQDRLYLNDGKGNFILARDALPPTLASGSCVRAADIDGDGDLDLFVGGRVVAGAYPLAPESYLLRNDGGKFTDITTEAAPALRHAGMITDALWTDYDGDGKADLLVVGEFMAPTFFRHDGDKLEKQSATNLESRIGWWNSLAAGDFDKDGDMDYIAGNLGRNNLYRFSEQHPLLVYAKDFDDNGSVDAIVSCYFKTEEGAMAEYPVHSWEELYSQSPKFRNQFSSYKQYGNTSMKALLSPYDTTGMLVLEAVYPSTSFIRNNGDGTFAISPLQVEVQVAPVNGMIVEDINGDSHLDVLMIGNDYGNEVFAGRYDAGTGVALFGDGKGGFTVHSSVETGFTVDGDGKALATLRTPQGDLFIATQNADSLRLFTKNNPSDDAKDFMPLATDFRAELAFSNGARQKIEFYHGSGYLSQSTRSVKIPSQATELIVFDYSGKSRV